MTDEELDRALGDVRRHVYGGGNSIWTMAVTAILEELVTRLEDANVEPE